MCRNVLTSSWCSLVIFALRDLRIVMAPLGFKYKKQLSTVTFHVCQSPCALGTSGTLARDKNLSSITPLNS